MTTKSNAEYALTPFLLPRLEQMCRGVHAIKGVEVLGRHAPGEHDRLAAALPHDRLGQRLDHKIPLRGGEGSHRCGIVGDQTRRGGQPRLL
ncbi:MAG: hypothetical protein ACRDQ4_13065 [Pseudonocardiaceae bacterium]